MTTIYLIRHGEVYNPNRILYGRLPGYGLSDNGKREIEETAKFLKKKHIDYIYSSPLLRAKQTAGIIRKKLNLPEIRISKYLLEVRTSYQGQPFASLSPNQREVYYAAKPTDETLDQIAKRLLKFVNIIIKKHHDKHIVFVSHGDPLMLLRSVLKGLPAAYTSVREGNGLSYIKHGEVIEVKITDDGNKTVNSIFIPTVLA